jgi:hypothetical protein
MEVEDDQVKFFGSATTASTTNVDPFALGVGPVQNSSQPVQDPFWDYAEAKDLKLRWNQLFPFQLLILEKVNGQYSQSGVRATFTLPIPPQELSISTPFAITTTVTLGGIVEEHNGAPIRMISLRGTTGVNPLRGGVERSNFVNLRDIGVFGGVLTVANQFQNTQQQIKSVVGAANGATEANVTSEDTFSGDMGNTTGYYQFLLLQRFLESYITQKKTSSGRNLRLAFALWKEKAVYLVTPVSFDVTRSAASPLEYMYAIALKAWRRITLEGNTTRFYAGTVGVQDPSKFAQVLNSIEAARTVLQEGQNFLKAVRADIQDALFTPLREAVLFAKDVNGIGTSIADFPAQLTVDLATSLLELAGLNISQPPASVQASHRALEDSLKSLSVQLGKGVTKGGQSTSTSQDQLAKGVNGLGASPAVKALNNPDDHFNFFSSVNVGDLNLRPETVRKIEAERRRVRLLKRADFEKSRDSILTVLADFSDFVGVGDTTYTRVYGLPVRSASKTPTDDDWDIIHALSAAAQGLDSMAVSSRIDFDFINSLDFVAGLASRSGIAFTVPASKFVVPFPYSYTLEQLSARYLGTPDRWHEIAALNGLRAPYVDEVGFSQKLLVNGNGNQIVVSDGAHYYSGQLVYLGSTTVRRERRRIQTINRLDVGQVIVVLDGANDLAKFTTIAQAEIQAFLPDTVNSQMQIYIPSATEPAEEDFLVKKIQGVDYFDPLIRSGGIDLLLTSSGDLIITPDGDSRLAVGFTNLIQKVRLTLGTPRGSLSHHPEFGLGIRIGTSTADLDAKDILSQARQLFRDDPGFSGVTAASVRKNGNNLQIGLGIGLAGSAQVVPVQVDIKA